MKELRVYFEGSPLLRSGFHRFLGEIITFAADARIRVNFVATKGRPIEDFKIALAKHPEAHNVLLLDSEGPLDSSSRRPRLNTISANQVFWMVELMEAWFLADPDSLEGYYGADFQRDSLPGRREIEQTPKAEVERGLKEATRRTKKGKYHKTKHAPDLLAKIDAAKVRTASPQCDRIFGELIAAIQQSD